METRQHRRRGFIGKGAMIFVLFAFVARCAFAADATNPVLVGVVTKVVDADTIDVRLSSGSLRVRLYGIDAPERSQPWGSEATAFLSGKILHQTVELEPFQQDRYERMIAIVHKGDVNVNTELMRLGGQGAASQCSRASPSSGAICARRCGNQ